MSLLDYFKRKEPFPDPSGPLARVLPASAIVGANCEVERSVRSCGNHEHRNPCETPFNSSSNSQPAAGVQKLGFDSHANPEPNPIFAHEVASYSRSSYYKMVRAPLLTLGCFKP